MSGEIYIDKFILKNRLGKGSYGEVFLGRYNPDTVTFNCQDNNDGEIEDNDLENVRDDVKIKVSDIPLAIKRIKNEPRFYRSAQREIRYLNELKEHNDSNYPVVSFFESFEFNNILYLVFEKMEINLYSYYRQNKVTYSQVLKILKDVCRGLEFIHSRNIIHGDLKPENIMLDSDFKNAKIIDFGSSFRYHKDEKRKYYYIQSRYYRAPECCFELFVGKPIDIWSLGCIMYEILFRKPLFPAQNVKYDLIYYFTIYLGIPINNPVSYNDYFLSPKFREYFKWNEYLQSYVIKVGQPQDLNPNPKGLMQKLNYKFHEIYPHHKFRETKTLMCQMITYDYYKRKTATEILENPIFDNFNN